MGQLLLVWGADSEIPPALRNPIFFLTSPDHVVYFKHERERTLRRSGSKPRRLGRDCSMTEDFVVLEALSKAGLCVCEKRYIESHNPALCDNEWVVGRLEESGFTE